MAIAFFYIYGTMDEWIMENHVLEKLWYNWYANKILWIRWIDLPYISKSSNNCVCMWQIQKKKDGIGRKRERVWSEWLGWLAGQAMFFSNGWKFVVFSKKVVFFGGAGWFFFLKVHFIKNCVLYGCESGKTIGYSVKYIVSINIVRR